jgi:hypothetical protein
VADRSIFGDEEERFLQALAREKVEFMIVGLSAATLQGAPVVTQDIDLWFKNLSDPRIQAALRTVNGTYVPPMMQNPPMFVGRDVKIFDIVVHMHGLGTFDEERENTVPVRLGRFKIPVLKLERIIASKKTLGRKKDKLTLDVLEDALQAIKEREKRDG